MSLALGTHGLVNYIEILKFDTWLKPSGSLNETLPKL